MSATARRLRRPVGSRSGRPGRGRLSGWLTRRRLGGLAALCIILVAAGLWLRGSSLVAVRQVRVVGVSGAQAEEITARLIATARTMTTLDFSTGRLAAAVSRDPVIARVSAHTHFPHGVTVEVQETIPVATIATAGRAVAVDAAGELLPRLSTAGLPRLSLATAPSAGQVTASGTRAVLRILGAAPFQMLAHIASAESTSGRGITVQLRHGPVLRFGDSSRAAAKWRAADAVLADPNSAGAAYVDVSFPERPAAG